MITGRGSWIAQRDAEDMQRKLLQQNTAKLTAREIIQILKGYKGRYGPIIAEIERKYKL